MLRYSLTKQRVACTNVASRSYRRLDIKGGDKNKNGPSRFNKAGSSDAGQSPDNKDNQREEQLLTPEQLGKRERKKFLRRNGIDVVLSGKEGYTPQDLFVQGRDLYKNVSTPDGFIQKLVQPRDDAIDQPFKNIRQEFKLAKNYYPTHQVHPSPIDDHIHYLESDNPRDPLLKTIIKAKNIRESIPYQYTIKFDENGPVQGNPLADRVQQNHQKSLNMTPIQMKRLLQARENKKRTLNAIKETIKQRASDLMNEEQPDADLVQEELRELRVSLMAEKAFGKIADEEDPEVTELLDTVNDEFASDDETDYDSDSNYGEDTEAVAGLEGAVSFLEFFEKKDLEQGTARMQHAASYMDTLEWEGMDEVIAQVATDPESEVVHAQFGEKLIHASNMDNGQLDLLDKMKDFTTMMQLHTQKIMDESDLTNDQATALVKLMPILFKKYTDQGRYPIQRYLMFDQIAQGNAEYESDFMKVLSDDSERGFSIDPADHYNPSAFDMLKNLRLLELRNNGKLTPELISAYRQPKGLEHIIASTLNQTRIHRDIESIRSDITLEGNMNKETEHDLGFLEDYFPRASLNFDDLMKNVNDEHSKHPIYDTEHQDLLEEDLIRYNNQSETPLEKEHDVKQEVFDENAINEAQGVPMAEGIELRELMDQYKLADLLKISEANDQEDEDGQNDPRANPLASKLGITTDHAKAKKEELDTFKLPLADAQDADLANAGSTASNLLSDIKLDILKQDEQTRDLNPSSEINDPKIKNSALFASIKKSILNKEPIKPIAPQPITDSIQSTFDSISTSSQQPPQEEEEEESEEESGLSEIDDSYLNQYLTNQIDPFDTYLPQELLMDDYLSPDAHDQFLELHQQVGVHRDAGKIAASNLKRYEQEETIVKRSLALTKQSLNSEHNTGILMDAFNERVDRQYEHIDITDSLSTVQSFLKQGSLSDALESEISQKSPELIDRFEPFQRTTLNQILAPGAGMNGQEEIKIIDDGDYLDANHSLLDSDKFHGLLYKDDPMAGAPLKDDRLLESSNSYYSSGELHVEFDPLLPRLGNHLGLKHTMQFYRDQARIEQEEYERTIAPTNTIYHARYVPGPENQSETMNRLTETKLTQLNRIDRVKTDVKDDFDESTIADIEDVLNDDEDDDPTYMSHHILAIAERFAHRAFLHEQYVREPQIPRPYIEDVQSGRVVSKTNWNMVGPIQNYFDGIIEEKVPEGPSSHIVTERLREYGRAVAKNTSMSLKEKIGAMRSLRQALLDNKIYDMELEAPSTIVTGRLTHWHEPRRNPRHTRFSDSVILNRKLYKKKLFVDLKKKEKERRIAEKRARAV